MGRPDMMEEFAEQDLTDFDLRMASFLALEGKDNNEVEGSELDNLLAEQYEIIDYPSLSQNQAQISSTVLTDTTERTERISPKIENVARTQPHLDHQKDFTAKHELGVKEPRYQEIYEKNLLSEIDILGKLYREEQSKTKSLLENLEEMQPLDFYKRNDEYFKSAIDGLRFQIKGWSHNLSQSLAIYVHPPVLNGVASYFLRKTGHKESSGPNYEFLRQVSTDWATYTLTKQGFKKILQAYLWKKLVELVFEDDSWACLSTPLIPDWKAAELPTAYRALRKKFQPDTHSNAHEVAQFHSWRSTTARLLCGQSLPSRICATITSINDSIIQPLRNATVSSASADASMLMPNPSHSPSTIRPKLHIQELYPIIEAAMKLAAEMAQQRAYYVFESLAIEELGTADFDSATMYTCQGVRRGDREMAKAVSLVLAPRVVRWGSMEGTCFDVCEQVVGMEVDVAAAGNKDSRTGVAAKC